VPTPIHSHVVDNEFVNTRAIWGEARQILVMDKGDWHAADGSSEDHGCSGGGRASHRGRLELLPLLQLRPGSLRATGVAGCATSATARRQARGWRTSVPRWPPRQGV